MSTSSKPNSALRRQRELRGWSQQKVADELEHLSKKSGASAHDIGRWERGIRIPGPFYREMLCLLFGCTADQLDFLSPTQSGNLHATSESYTAPAMLLPLQQQINLGDIMAKRFDPTRRLLLQMLGAAGAAAITPEALNSDSWDRLASVLVKPSRIDDATLAHIEQLSDVCWNLSNTDQLEMAEQILPTYLPKITALAHQSSQQQTKAAALAARGYILAAEIDKTNVIAMQAYAQQAVFYSQFTQDMNVQVDALRQEATIALVAKQPLKALLTYQKALPLIDQVSPLLRSRIYLGLASASARCGGKNDALRYLGQAQEHFPDKPEDDPNFIYMYTSGSRSVLHLYEALTFNDLQQPRDAWQSLMKVNGVQPKLPVTESARIEFINLQAKTAAVLGHMDESMTLLQIAVDAADAAGYPVWREEAAEIYQELAQLWPYELQVRRLGKLFQKGA